MINGTKIQVCNKCENYKGRNNLYICCNILPHRRRGCLVPSENPPKDCLYIEDHKYSIKLWLDDERKEPDGFIRVKTVSKCIEYLKTGDVRHINFDHDLGTKQTGYDLALWIEKRSFCDPDFRVPSFRIQSANVVGSKNIEIAMKRARKICENPMPDLNWNEEILL